MRKFLAIVTAVALAAIAFGIAGCSDRAGESESVKKIKALQGEFPVAVKDDAGRAVELDKKPERLVSLAPANTEMLFALGLGDKVVGVSTYCDYPDEAKSKEKVGDFANPNIERIIALKPDIVFAAAGVQKPIIKRLDEAGVKLFVVDPKSVDGILDTIERVAVLTGGSDEASKLVEGLKKRVAAVEDRAAKAKTKPKVFYEVYSQPLMTAGGPSVVNDLIEKAGGANVAAGLETEFPLYSLETLVKNDPEFYIASTGAMAEPGDIKNRPGWESLKAVKEDKVLVFDENIMNRYGPRLIDGLEAVAKAIHPELY
ncbi:MAG: ABC transporter substrate-binding protein [Candidatus Aquicultorales bacterium]